MADGWEYAMLYLDADGQGTWTGWLIFDGMKPQEILHPSNYQRLALFNELGREGWEVVSQSANQSRQGFVYGWEWLLKRPL